MNRKRFIKTVLELGAPALERKMDGPHVTFYLDQHYEHVFIGWLCEFRPGRAHVWKYRKPLFITSEVGLTFSEELPRTRVIDVANRDAKEVASDFWERIGKGVPFVNETQQLDEIVDLLRRSTEAARRLGYEFRAPVVKYAVALCLLLQNQDDEARSFLKDIDPAFGPPWFKDEYDAMCRLISHGCDGARTHLKEREVIMRKRLGLREQELK